MIVNDTHRFVFVHVPKCAGSTVRRRLRHLDETGGKFGTPYGSHPDLGSIDMGHIPLFVLRRHFPEEYEKVREYAAFALVRDPFDRFPSSLSQRFNMYGESPMRRVSEAEIREEIDGVIRFLEDRADARSYLPAEYIHFQRQVDFILDQGMRVVDRVYGTDQVNRLIDDIAARAGAALPEAEERINESMVFRSDAARGFVEAVRPVARAMLPEPLRRWLGERVLRGLSVPRSQRFAHLFAVEHVQDFIRRYYAADIALFESVTGRPVKGAR